jgi:hypothetical protein
MNRSRRAFWEALKCLIADDPLTLIWPLNTTPLGRIYLAVLQSQIAVSQELLQDSLCTCSAGCNQVSRLKAGEKTAQACDIAC